MKHIMKLCIVGLMLGASTQVYAKQTVETMKIKLANLEVDIAKKKLKLVHREEKLNEMKVKALQSNKIDKENMALKLAEIETALVKDRLLLTEREVKLNEMKVALLKVQLGK